MVKHDIIHPNAMVNIAIQVEQCNAHCPLLTKRTWVIFACVVFGSNINRALVTLQQEIGSVFLLRNKGGCKLSCELILKFHCRDSIQILVLKQETELMIPVQTGNRTMKMYTSIERILSVDH